MAQTSVAALLAQKPQPLTAQQLRALATQDAQKYGVNPGVFTRQIQQESGFNPAARSGAGAVGIAQFMPATAKSYGIDPTNPTQALDAAARYDANELKAFHGDYRSALAAYNAGAGNADKWNDPNFAGGQTYNYVRKILGGGPLGSAAPPSPASGTEMPTNTGRSPVAEALTPVKDYQPKLASLLQSASSGGGDYSQFYATLKNALQTRQQPQTPQPAAAPTSSVQPPAQGAPGSPSLIHGNTGGEQATFLQRLGQLAQYEHAPIDINSGYRSLAKQQQLWANRASNPNPVAQPGHSLHEQGLAADGTVNGIPLGTLPAALLARFGLASVPGDPVHVQIAARR